VKPYAQALIDRGELARKWASLYVNVLRLAFEKKIASPEEEGLDELPPPPVEVGLWARQSGSSVPPRGQPSARLLTGRTLALIGSASSSLKGSTSSKVSGSQREGRRHPFARDADGL
jgi:hypothetical protein